jgi:cell division protein FtsI/penicillin-binding protein 2
MNRPNSGRFFGFGAFLSLIPMLILWKVISFQTGIVKTDYLESVADAHLQEVYSLEVARGQIYDRNGHVLAANRKVYEVNIQLDWVRNPQTIAEYASRVLGLKSDEVLDIASLDPTSTGGRLTYTIADFVLPEKIDLLEQEYERLKNEYEDSRLENPPSLKGLVYRAHLQRIYPEDALASNVIGFVTADQVGKFGVEQYYDDLLHGDPKTIARIVNPMSVTDLPKLPDGASLVLTLHRELQIEMERIVDEAMAETGSDSATIVILDPRTGELLALATTPRMNLNTPTEYEKIYGKSLPYNRIVTESIEPGSTFKVLTMGAAMDAGVVTPDTEFLDKGVFTFGSAVVYNWDHGAYGPQTMLGCMRHSLNVCLSHVAVKTGANTYYSYLKRFNIGRATGVDMAGESNGILRVPAGAGWTEEQLVYNSFGQGLSVTPLQLAAAVSAFANDGKMMAPHVVRSMVTDGYQRDTEIRVSGMPISAETAHKMTEMLATSLKDEASDALVTGYQVAGKTGTAEIAIPGYGYSETDTNASFIGWGPVDDPKFVVYVWLEKPSTSIWGSVVAAPIFRQVVEKLVVYLNLPPDDIRLQLAQQ